MFINYNDFFITYCPFLIFLYVVLFKVFCFLRYLFVKYLNCYIKKNVVENFISHNIASHVRDKPIRELLLNWQLYSHLKFQRLIGISICEHLSKRCHNSDSIRSAY
jgi:hypothetical protein